MRPGSRRVGYQSKYPPAEPGALGLEPLKAACPCCPARLSSPTLRNASPVCAEATRVGPIAAALYNAPHLRVCIATWSALSFHSDPSTGFPFVCLAALGSESRRWTEGVDPRICQTFAASPAEPGELPYLFSRDQSGGSGTILRPSRGWQDRDVRVGSCVTSIAGPYGGAQVPLQAILK